MDTVEALRAFARDNPEATAAMAAAHLGISRQRVQQLCKREQVKLRDGRSQGRRSERGANHFGGPQRLPSTFIGGACELSAAADLLRRGIPVYRAMTSVSSADLVVEINGELRRVEVRAAKRVGGSLRYGVPALLRYDILALVESDGRVTYKPDPFAGPDGVVGYVWPERKTSYIGAIEWSGGDRPIGDPA